MDMTYEQVIKEAELRQRVRALVRQMNVGELLILTGYAQCLIDSRPEPPKKQPKVVPITEYFNTKVSLSQQLQEQLEPISDSVGESSRLHVG